MRNRPMKTELLERLSEVYEIFGTRKFCFADIKHIIPYQQRLITARSRKWIKECGREIYVGSSRNSLQTRTQYMFCESGIKAIETWNRKS